MILSNPLNYAQWSTYINELINQKYVQLSQLGKTVEETYKFNE